MNYNAKFGDLKPGDVWRAHRNSEYVYKVTDINPLGDLVAIDSLAFPDDGQRYEDLCPNDTGVFITTI